MQKILFDANVIIEFHRFSIWKHVIHACQGAVTPIIKREVRFYKDLKGEKNPIDLSQYVQSQEIEEILVSQKEFVSLETVLHNFFLQSIDEGEREAIAFLYSNQKSNKYLFCTLDQLAIKCLGILGLRFHGISIEELLKKLHIKAEFSSPYKQRYSKELFDRMLIEGFKESHFHLRQEIILT